MSHLDDKRAAIVPGLVHALNMHTHPSLDQIFIDQRNFTAHATLNHLLYPVQGLGTLVHGQQHASPGDLQAAHSAQGAFHSHCVTGCV
jgi:hypothetical protein